MDDIVMSAATERDPLLLSYKGRCKQAKQNGPELQKQLTLFNAITSVVGCIVGSGIFITPTTVLMYSGSFGVSLIFWLVGGIIAAAGGLVFVELGAMIKNSGAGYAYLRDGFTFGSEKPVMKALGNTVGFAYIWCFVLLVMPLSVAILGQTAGLYLCQAMKGGRVTPNDLPIQLIASSLIILCTLINLLNVRVTAMIVDAFSVAKILAMLFIIGLGVWQLIVGDHIDNFKNAFEDTTTCVGDIVVALYFVIYSYDGWCSVGFIVEECKNAERNLLHGLVIGVIIVVVCYMCVNVSYYAGLSKIDLLLSPATALVLGESLLGRVGLIIFPLLVAVSTTGALMFNIYSGPRAVFSAARDGNLPEALSLLQNTSNTPVPAIILQSVLSIGFVFGGSMSQLINGLSVSEWIFYGLIFLSCIIMRFTRRNYKRPFKVWIIVPIFMVLVSIFLILVPIILVPDNRIISVMVIGIVLAGIPFYIILGWDRLRPKFIDKFSDIVTLCLEITLDCSSTRTNEHKITVNEIN